MDTEKYEKQMNEMLADTNTYEVLKKNPTEDCGQHRVCNIQPI